MCLDWPWAVLSHIAHASCEQMPSDVQCDMWQEGSLVHVEHHLICEISLVPYLQHLSGHVLTINYSPVQMKWAADEEALMPDSSWNVSSRDCAFNISDVWAAHTVYVTACSLAPLKATAALSFKPLLKPVIVDWSNSFVIFHLKIWSFPSKHMKKSVCFQKVWG